MLIKRFQNVQKNVQIYMYNTFNVFGSYLRRESGFYRIVFGG